MGLQGGTAYASRIDSYIGDGSNEYVKKDAGFVVTSKIDLRSFGGGLKVKKARWIISSKKLEIDNDKGLFVVSSSEDYTRETGCDSVRSDLQ